jgi:chromosome segregation ATPase
MTADNQALLEAIRGVVTEAVAPLETKVDTLTERVDTLTERVDKIEVEQREQRRISQLLLTRTSDLAMKLDGAMSELYGIQERLSGVEERVHNGFHALKDDLTLAFKDIQRFRSDYTRRADQADREIKAAMRRLDALEEGRSAS